MKEIIEAINKCQTVTIVTHDIPDEDAIGSVVAVQEILVQLGKTVRLFFQTKFNCIFREFIGPYYTRYNYNDYSDLVIVLDSSSLKRIGQNVKELGDKIIAIDHHGNFESFGTINYKEKAVSTTEIIFRLAKKMNIKMTDRFATAVYMGIYGDTDGFSNRIPDTNVLEVMNEFNNNKCNIDSGLIIKSQSFNYNILKVYNNLLKDIRFDADYGIVCLLVDVTNRNFSVYDVKNVLYILKKIDSNIQFLFIRNKNKIYTKARSIKYDVNRIMNTFGGGGHTFAAGSVNTYSSSFIKNVLKRAKEEITKR